MAITLESFRQTVATAQALDGDLVVKGNGANATLNKVNFGGATARRWLVLSDRKTTATEAQTKEVIAKFYNSIRADLVSKGDDVSQDTRSRVLAEIRQKLHIDVNGDDADAVADNVGRGGQALSRREVRRVIESYDKQIGGGVEDASSWGGAEAKRVGGMHGLHLKRTEVAAMVAHLKERGLETFAGNDQRFRALRGKGRELAVKAFEQLANDCLNGYARGSSRGLIEKAFANGLALESIGGQLAEMVLGEAKNLPTPLFAAEPVADGLISPEARESLDRYWADLEDTADTSSMVKFDSGFDRTYRAESKTINGNPSFQFVADLICNSDAVEVADYGFGSGARVARVFLKNPKTFLALCKDVAQRDQEVKNGARANDLNKHEVFKLLGNVTMGTEADKAIATTLESIVRKVNAKCFPEGFNAANVNEERQLDTFRWTCFAQADEICAAAGANYNGVTFESAVEAALTVQDIKTSISDSLVKLVLGDNESGSRNQPLYHALMASVDKADSYMLRRMFASAMRYAPEDEDHTWESPLDQSKMLMEMGPVVYKLLQERLADETDDKARQALACVRGDLPGLGAELVKAMVADVIRKVNDNPNGLGGRKIESITLLDSLGAASIAQTFKARIKFKGEEGEGRTVALKLLRPDVKKHFDDEIRALTEHVNDALSAVALNSDADQNEDKINDLNMVKTQFGQRKDSVGKEFDLSAEMDNTLRCYANLLPGDNAQQNHASVKTAKPVLLVGEDRFDDAVRTYKADPSADNLGTVRNCTVPCSPSVMISEFVNAPTVDKLVNQNLSKRNGYKLLQALEQVSRKMVNGLINGRPPYVHLDMHASNLLVNVSGEGQNLSVDGITLIDHGKQFEVTEEQRQKLVDMLNFVCNKNSLVTKEEKELRDGGMEEVKASIQAEVTVVNKAIKIYEDYITYEKNKLTAEKHALESQGIVQGAKVNDIDEKLGLLEASLAKINGEKKVGHEEVGSLKAELRGVLEKKPLETLLGVCTTLETSGYYMPSTFKDFIQTFIKLFQCEDLVMKKLELDTEARKDVLDKMKQSVESYFDQPEEKVIKEALVHELDAMKGLETGVQAANIEGCLSEFQRIIGDKLGEKNPQSEVFQRAKKFLEDNFTGKFEIDEDFNCVAKGGFLNCPPKLLQDAIFGLEADSADSRDVGIVRGFSDALEENQVQPLGQNDGGANVGN